MRRLHLNLNLTDVIVTLAVGVLLPVLLSTAAGIVAVELGLRHPSRIRRALVFEPGYFGNIPGGEAFGRPANDVVSRYLDEHPGDWPGAYDAFLRAVARPGVTDDPGFLAPPLGKEWHAERERSNAEAFVRDDLPILTREVLDERRLSSTLTDMRFSYGAASIPLFRQLASQLAAVRGSDVDRIEAVGHVLYWYPDEAAAYVRSRQT